MSKGTLWSRVDIVDKREWNKFKNTQKAKSKESGVALDIGNEVGRVSASFLTSHIDL